MSDVQIKLEVGMRVKLLEDSHDWNEETEEYDGALLQVAGATGTVINIIAKEHSTDDYPVCVQWDEPAHEEWDASYVAYNEITVILN